MGKLVDTIKGKIGSAVSSVRNFTNSVVTGVKNAYNAIPAVIKKALPVVTALVSPVLGGSVIAASNIKSHIEGSSAGKANSPPGIVVAPQGNPSNTSQPLNTTNIALVLVGMVGLYFLSRSS